MAARGSSPVIVRAVNKENKAILQHLLLLIGATKYNCARFDVLIMLSQKVGHLIWNAIWFNMLGPSVLWKKLFKSIKMRNKTGSISRASLICIITKP